MRLERKSADMGVSCLHKVYVMVLDSRSAHAVNK